ncbi:MAG TPA: hypothetical protein VIF82_03205 [Burkholderiaceae bacterium]|jgi:hypothetical protein
MTEHTSPATAPDILRATWRARLLLCASVLLVLVFFLLCQFIAIPFLNTALSTVPPSHLTAVKTMLIGFASIASLVGLGTILYGRKILRKRQYPPGNAWVWRDTLIQHGRIAVRFGWLHIVTGILICIIGLGSSLYLWRLVDQLLPRSSYGKHIIILQQKSGT